MTVRLTETRGPAALGALRRRERSIAIEKAADARGRLGAEAKVGAYGAECGTVDARRVLRLGVTPGEKHELVNGMIVAFAGGASDHHRISGNVFAWLHSQLVRPCQAFVSDAIIEPITRKSQSGLRADVVVTCAERDFGRAKYISQPRIIVEVRSPSNGGPIWDGKLLQYWNTPSVQQVVVIETEERLVESYRRDDDGSWNDVVTVRGAGSVFFIETEAPVSLDVIYDRTTRLEPTFLTGPRPRAAASASKRRRSSPSSRMVIVSPI